MLGTAAFTSLALLVAGTLRAEAVLAVANLLLLVLAVAGGVVIPASQLPGPMAHVALLLPSGALGEAMRETLMHGVAARVVGRGPRRLDRRARVGREPPVPLALTAIAAAAVTSLARGPVRRRRAGP